MITALRSRAFQAKWNRATRRDRRRVLSPRPERLRHGVALSVCLSVAMWVAALGLVLW